MTQARCCPTIILLFLAASLGSWGCGDSGSGPTPGNRPDAGDDDAADAGGDAAGPDADDTDVADTARPDVGVDANPADGSSEGYWDDLDNDGYPDRFDNCLGFANSDQADLDADGVGDACDTCPRAFDPGQEDSDDDGIGDACERLPCDSGVLCDAGLGSEPVCCDVGQECFSGACVDVCPEGIRCDGVCCGDDELCVSSVCVPLGPECTNDGDCDYTSFCDESVGRCLSFPDELTCRRPGDFDVSAPVEQWHFRGLEVDGQWYGNVIAVPTVADIDTDGVPEVVVAVYSTSLADAILVGLSGDTGEVEYVNSAYSVLGARHLAIGNYDADEGLEIAVSTLDHLGVLDDFAACRTPSPENDFCFRWRVASEGFSGLNAGTALLATDFNSDGSPEVVSGNRIFRASNGELLVEGLDGQASGRGLFQTQMPIAADLTGDGRPELLAGHCAYVPDLVAGTLTELWCARGFTEGFPGVADLIGDDGQPEVVVVSAGSLHVLEAGTGAVVHTLDLPGDGHGGAPNIADFDGDGRPEIGTANAGCYTVFDLDCLGSTNVSGPGCDRPSFDACTPGVDCFEVEACDALETGTGDGVLWTVATQDLSSSQTGSSVFDFQGDGRAEVLYNDECRFLALDGQTGRPYLRLYNTSRTASEYPVVVDVDGDLRSEIVFVANNDEFVRDCAGSIVRRPDLFPDCEGLTDGEEVPEFCLVGTQGVRVLRDPSDSWVRTRQIWNQHAYDITNVLEDGTIPATAVPSWEASNTYRGNRQGQALLNAPDVLVASVVADNSACPFEQTFNAQVVNRGDLTAPAGLQVQLFDLNGELVSQRATPGPLPPGGAVTIELVRFGPMPVINEFQVRVVAAESAEPILECDDTNNTTLVNVPCGCQVEECDGADNNCDGVIDNFGCLGCGLIGESCETDSSCCAASCIDGECAVPCRPIGVSCLVDRDCCEGVCTIFEGNVGRCTGQ